MNPIRELQPTRANSTPEPARGLRSKLSNGVKKFVIIDALAVLHRAWHALPKLKTEKGQIVNAVYGFSSFLLKILREEKPDCLAVAYDTEKPNFRKEKFKEYKENGPKQPREFYDQVKISQKILEAFSIKYFLADGLEADDLIGALAEKSKKEGEIIVFTGDKDLLQIVNEKIKVSYLKRSIAETKLYDEKAVIQEYKGLKPEQLVDFKALVGDPADNIKGLKGIGPKAAISLLKKYGSLKNLYEQIETSKDRTIDEKTLKILKEGKEKAFFFKDLLSLKSEIEVENFKLENCLLKFDKEKVKKVFEEFGFKTLISRLQKINNLQKSLF